MDFYLSYYRYFTVTMAFFFSGNPSEIPSEITPAVFSGILPKDHLDLHLGIKTWIASGTRQDTSPGVPFGISA